MEWGTIAGLITAICTALTALGGLLVTVKVMIPNFRVNKETHTIVNQQRTDMKRYTEVLKKFILSQGLELPEDQSKLD